MCSGGAWVTVLLKKAMVVLNLSLGVWVEAPQCLERRSADR